MLDDVEDLLGEPIPYLAEALEVRRGRGRPKGSPNTKTLIAKRQDARSRYVNDGAKLNHSHTPDREQLIREAEELKALDGEEGTSIKLSQIAHGVPIPFLCHVFRKTQHHTKERLRPITPIRYGKNGAHFYDLFEAAEVLVDPKVDIAAYMRGLKLEDLPPHLQENYWNIKKKRRDFEADAMDLWHTQDVLETLGDMFKILRNRLQLFGDSLDDRSPLSLEHRRLLREMTNNLMGEMREDLLRNMKERRTPSTVAELKDIPLV